MTLLAEFFRFSAGWPLGITIAVVAFLMLFAALCFIPAHGAEEQKSKQDVLLIVGAVTVVLALIAGAAAHHAANGHRRHLRDASHLARNNLLADQISNDLDAEGFRGASIDVTDPSQPTGTVDVGPRRCQVSVVYVHQTVTHGGQQRWLPALINQDNQPVSFTLADVQGLALRCHAR